MFLNLPAEQLLRISPGGRGAFSVIAQLQTLAGSERKRRRDLLTPAQLKGLNTGAEGY